MIKYVVLLAMTFSCAEQEGEIEQLHQKTNQAVWVCHNTSSQQHGKVCSEECMEEGSTDKFCWLITARDCDPPLQLEWQKHNCHLLENQP